MIKIPLALGGRHRLNAIRPDGRRRPLLDWRDNIILNRGLDEIANVGTYLDTHHVGGGSSQPTAFQESLVSPISATENRVSANSAAVSSSPYRGYSQVTWLYPVGAITSEVREIGVGSSASNGAPLFCRALALDALNSPTGVLPLPDEQLEAIYELSITFPENDVQGDFSYIDVDGIERVADYLLRPAQATTGQYWAPYNANAFESPGQAVRALFETASGEHCRVYDGSIGVITNLPGGSVENCSAVINEDYVPGSHRRIAHIQLSETAGNFAEGVSAALVRLNVAAGSGGASLGSWQIEMTPAVVKNNEHAAYIDVTLQWGRA